MSFQPTNTKDKNTYKPSLFVGAYFLCILKKVLKYLLTI
nr:MAG TPA: hypothetical protein [Caudoviricetes sp.]